MKVKILKLHNDAITPSNAHGDDVGYDLYSVESNTIDPGERKLFKTGIAMQPEPGYEIQFRPRSGLALKHGITVLNTPATVDPSYTGELMVLLINTSKVTYKINIGDRIAQAVFKKYELVEFDEVEELESRTGRSEKGFGSSGS